MRLRSFLPLAAALLAIGGAASAQGFTVTINVDENGNGTLTNSDGFFGTLASGLQDDPGPGGLTNVLTYDLLNPPGLTEGDVLLFDPDFGTFLDVVRFNPNEISPSGGLGSLVFYSDNVDGFDDLADTFGPPTAFYTNVVTITEGDAYTPTAGQPGFVTGAGGPVTYILNSDIESVPEPGSVAMLVGMGVTGAGFLVRRRRK